MVRSLWKGNFLLPISFENLSQNLIIVYKRSMVISSDYIGKRVAIYNGMKFVSLIIKPLMVGRKFGEFSITKKLGSRIHTMGRLSKKKKK